MSIILLEMCPEFLMAVSTIVLTLRLAMCVHVREGKRERERGREREEGRERGYHGDIALTLPVHAEDFQNGLDNVCH